MRISEKLYWALRVSKFGFANSLFNNLLFPSTQTCCNDFEKGLIFFVVNILRLVPPVWHAQYTSMFASGIFAR